MNMVKTLIAVSTAASLTFASSFLSDAHAATGYSYYATGISVNGETISRPGHIVAKDQLSGVTTSFLPIWYIETALKQLGITPTWDGQTLNLTTPSTMTVNYPSTPAKGTISDKAMVIEINGHVVTYGPKITYYDQGSQSTETTFAPIYYLENSLKCLGFTVNWNGNNLNITASNPQQDNAVQSTLVKNVGVSGTQMVEAPDGTLYVLTQQGNVVKLDAEGNIEATSKTNFDTNIGLFLSPDGQTLYAVGVGYFGSKSFDNDSAFGTAVDTIGTDVINTADMSYTSGPAGSWLNQLSPDGETLYSVSPDSDGLVFSYDLATQLPEWEFFDPRITNAKQITISPDGTTLYIGGSANGSSNELVEVNTKTQTVQTENIDGGYDGMLLSPDGSTMYLTNWGSNPEVVKFSTSSKSVTGSPITGNYLPKNDPSDGSILAMSGSLLFGVGNINGQKAVCVVDTSQNKVEGAVMNKDFGKIEAITASNNGNTLDVLTDNGLYIYNLQIGTPSTN